MRCLSVSEGGRFHFTCLIQWFEVNWYFQVVSSLAFACCIACCWFWAISTDSNLQQLHLLQFPPAMNDLHRDGYRRITRIPPSPVRVLDHLHGLDREEAKVYNWRTHPPVSKPADDTTKWSSLGIIICKNSKIPRINHYSQLAWNQSRNWGRKEAPSNLHWHAEAIAIRSHQPHLCVQGVCACMRALTLKFFIFLMFGKIVTQRWVAACAWKHAAKSLAIETIQIDVTVLSLWIYYKKTLFLNTKLHSSSNPSMPKNAGKLTYTPGMKFLTLISDSSLYNWFKLLCWSLCI